MRPSATFNAIVDAISSMSVTTAADGIKDITTPLSDADVES